MDVQVKKNQSNYNTLGKNFGKIQRDCVDIEILDPDPPPQSKSFKKLLHRLHRITSPYSPLVTSEIISIGIPDRPPHRSNSGSNTNISHWRPISLNGLKNFLAPMSVPAGSGWRTCPSHRIRIGPHVGNLTFLAVKLTPPFPQGSQPKPYQILFPRCCYQKSQLSSDVAYAHARARPRSSSYAITAVRHGEDAWGAMRHVRLGDDPKGRKMQNENVRVEASKIETKNIKADTNKNGRGGRDLDHRHEQHWSGFACLVCSNS